MPEYKAILKFESTATVYIEADDEASATSALESISEADLRQATLWEHLFVGINARLVVAIAEDVVPDRKR